MKKILEALRGARRIELLLALAAVSVLLLLQLPESGGVGFAGQTNQEARIAAILGRIEGVGRVEVMLSEQESGGVLVVSDGAKDLAVCLRIQYAVQTLLGTDVSRIEIVPYTK